MYSNNYIIYYTNRFVTGHGIHPNPPGIPRPCQQCISRQYTIPTHPCDASQLRIMKRVAKAVLFIYYGKKAWSKRRNIFSSNAQQEQKTEMVLINIFAKHESTRKSTISFVISQLLWITNPPIPGVSSKFSTVKMTKYEQCQIRFLLCVVVQYCS